MQPLGCARTWSDEVVSLHNIFTILHHGDLASVPYDVVGLRRLSQHGVWSTALPTAFGICRKREANTIFSSAFASSLVGARDLCNLRFFRSDFRAFSDFDRTSPVPGSKPLVHQRWGGVSNDHPVTRDKRIFLPIGVMCYSSRTKCCQNHDYKVQVNQSEDGASKLFYLGTSKILLVRHIGADRPAFRMVESSRGTSEIYFQIGQRLLAGNSEYDSRRTSRPQRSAFMISQVR